MSQDQPIVLDPTYASFDAAARPADLGATHFIGIGGAGMSVLAEMLHAEGVAVDGSDRAHSAKTDRLETLGITVEFGQRAENVAQAETVVYSSAIKPDNPEIVAAHAAGKRIVHRSDILALLMNGSKANVLAGEDYTAVDELDKKYRSDYSGGMSGASRAVQGVCIRALAMSGDTLFRFFERFDQLV